MGTVASSFFVLKMINILSGETLGTKKSHASISDAREIFQAGNFHLSIEEYKVFVTYNFLFVRKTNENLK